MSITRDATTDEDAAGLVSRLAWRRAAAVLCIFCLIITWLTMAEVVQGVEDQFPKPFFLRLCVNGLYSSCLLVWVVWRFLKGRSLGSKTNPYEFVPGGEDGNQTAGNLSQRQRALAKASGPTYNYLGYFNWCYFFGASIVLGIAAFLSGWLWYVSLPRTSVSANSAIYQSMCFVVYLFSVLFLNESTRKLKTTAVLVSVSGVILVSYFGTARPTDVVLQTPLRKITYASTDIVATTASHESFVGYFFCVASMTLYALYEVLYKKWASHSADPYPFMNSIRFLGLVGLSTLVFCSPFLTIVDLTGSELFDIPTFEQMEMILLVGFLDTVFNLLLLFVIMLTSPLFASVGCLLVLPASLAWDYFFHRSTMPFWALVGVGCIISGFCLFLADEYFTASSTTYSSFPPLYDFEIGDEMKISGPPSRHPVQSKQPITEKL